MKDLSRKVDSIKIQCRHGQTSTAIHPKLILNFWLCQLDNMELLVFNTF